MLDERACGTYWYCVNEDGSRWLTTGPRPVKSSGGYMKGSTGMGWLNLDDNDNSTNPNNYVLYSSELKDLRFPDITYEDGPLEIEIVKSGNVYWYDD